MCEHSGALFLEVFQSLNLAPGAQKIPCYLRISSYFACALRSAMQSMLLIPTFKPPPTSLGRNDSQFERLNFLLSVRPHIDSKPTLMAARQLDRACTNLTEGHKKSATGGDFELFEGAIVIDSCIQTHSKGLENSSTEGLTTNITQVGRPRKFQQLANFLDNEIESSIPKSGNRTGERPKAANKGKLSEPEKDHEQSHKRNRRNEQETSSENVFEVADFVGIERFCRNAGGSVEGLRAFVRKVQGSPMVAISVLFQCLSTNHCTTTVKYCTQSLSCRHWNCICDRHVRSNYLANNVMGVIVRIPAESETLYFLPLMDCLDPRNTGSTSQSSGKRKLLPMQCGSSLQERVVALGEVFSYAGTEKVVFNAQVALIPVLHLIGLYPTGPASTALSRTTSDWQGVNSPDMVSRSKYCLETMNNLFDPRLGAYLCDSDISETQLELESLFDKYPHVRGVPAASAATAWGASSASSISTVQQADSCRIPIANHELVGLGSAARAVQRVKGELNCLLGLHAALAAEMSKLGIAPIFRGIEMPMACLLASIEHCGVVVDCDFLSQQRALVTQHINATETQIFAAVAPALPFNVASPEQVAHVLFDVLQLPPPAQTSKKGKHHSTSEEDLLRIRHCHPVVDLILNYRALAKISSTYVDGLKPFICKETEELHCFLNGAPGSNGHGNAMGSDGESSSVSPNAFAVLMHAARSTAHAAQVEAQLELRIHAYWQQTVVRTGRLSCTKPNLQNIPNKQNIARLEINMRCAFRASLGCVLVSADYSQIEMRVLAHLCQDSVLLGLFRHSEGYDIYRHLAARIFKKPVTDVAEDERTKAKVICLGVLYGMGPQAAAAKLSISVEAASGITQTFFDNFKQIRTWIQQIKAQAKQHGCVRTLLGRLRHLPDLHSPDPAKSSYAERQAVNSVIQGTASDLIKYAMINVDRQLALQWPATLYPAPRVLMQIHDELIYEVSGADPHCVQRLEALLHTAMEEQVVAALKLTVPLVANVHTGLSWGDIEG